MAHISHILLNKRYRPQWPSEPRVAPGTRGTHGAGAQTPVNEKGPKRKSHYIASQLYNADQRKEIIINNQCK